MTTTSLSPRQLELLTELGRVWEIEAPTPVQRLFGAALGDRGLAQIGSNGRIEITEKGHAELRNRLTLESPPAEA